MPSRTESHQCHRHYCTGVDQKTKTHSPISVKPRADVSTTRPRSRFGTSATDTVSSQAGVGNSCQRVRRHSFITASSRCCKSQAKHTNSRGSKIILSGETTTSPLLNKAGCKAGLVIDAYANSGDESVNRGVVVVDPSAEDENSFSSSVFSEHLAQSDIQPLVMKTVSNESDLVSPAQVHCIVTNDNSLIQDENLTDDDDEETDVDEDNEVEEANNPIDQNELATKTDVAGLLLNDNSILSTPIIVASNGDTGSLDGSDDDTPVKVRRMQSDTASAGLLGRSRSSNADSFADPGFRLINNPQFLSRINSSSTISATPTTNSEFNDSPPMQPVDDDSVLTVTAASSAKLPPSSSFDSVFQCTTCSPSQPGTVSYNSSTPIQLSRETSTIHSRMVTRSQAATTVSKGSLSFPSDFPATPLHPKSKLSSSLPTHVDGKNPNEPLSSCPVSAPPCRSKLGKQQQSRKVAQTPNTAASTCHRAPTQLSAPSACDTTTTTIANSTQQLAFESRIESATEEVHVYPLRSRLRRELMWRRMKEAQAAPKAFDELPTEVLFRVTHYLSIQDVFRLQRVAYRFKSIVERYLLLVKRINFSNGLPFAFLPESVNDTSLKRILSRTPEVTHILGFYPRRIAGSFPSDCHYLGSRMGCNTQLTYAGIVAAFRTCPKLRSVELMDVELMSKLVYYLPRIKFHGMFRNRPDSWDCEYAVPLPPEPHVCCHSPQPTTTSPSLPADSETVSTPTHQLSPNMSSLFCSATATASVSGSHHSRSRSRRASNVQANDWLSCVRRHPVNTLTDGFTSNSSGRASHNSVVIAATKLAHKCACQLFHLTEWFEPLGESPLGHGTPSIVPHFLPSSRLSMQPQAQYQQQVYLDNHPQHHHFQNPVNRHQYHNNALDVLRTVSIAPFLQPGLPPIEAELIAAGSVAPGRYHLGHEGFDLGRRNQPVAPLLHDPQQQQHPMVAVALGAVFVLPYLLGPVGLPLPGGNNLPPQAADHPMAYARPFRRLPMAHRQPVAPAPAHQSPQNNSPQGHRFYRQIPGALPPTANAGGEPNNCSPSGPWLVSPLPSPTKWIGLPHTITNLTKLDLVSVSINSIPRLDNIKYLHLKWVVFTSTDPFLNFSATKLQSFVMNNCSGPSGVVRFMRIFSALARAPQLARLELVGTRVVQGPLGHIFDDALVPGRGFRNLQRLVLSSNKDATEVDIGLLLLGGQHSLNHVALQITHTRNSLFEALWHADAKFMRLENLVLGFQDPYQSRLTVSELMSLGLGESFGHLMPMCGLTDWGLQMASQLFPRLSNLTIRHAPYLHYVTHWWSHGSATSTPANEPPATESTDAGTVQSSVPSASKSAGDAATGTATSTSETTNTVSQSPPLRSLTLENCPGISMQSLEEAISTGSPFPCLETLVLRDMFLSRYHTDKDAFSAAGLSHHWPTKDAGDVDWRLVGLLMSLSDLLVSRRVGYSPMVAEGIGMATSVREVGYLHQSPPGLRMSELPIKSMDLFYTLRLHYYLNTLLEYSGHSRSSSRGNKGVAAALLLPALADSNKHTNICSSVATSPSPPDGTDFVSQSTQTCICGLLEWELLQRLSNPSHGDTSQHCDSPSTRTRTVSGNNNSSSRGSNDNSSRRSVLPTPPSSQHRGCQSSPQQLGGPQAFHPFPPSVQHLCFGALTSVWAQQTWNSLTTSIPFKDVSAVQSTGHCPHCCSNTDLQQTCVSAWRAEVSLHHRARRWLARDAGVDTSELRVHTGSGALVFSISQPLVRSATSNLTSLHLEKVGISHLVLGSAPRLKNVTLENCPNLRAVLFTNHVPSVESLVSAPSSSSAEIDRLPALRRLRVIRCPKFAIRRLLHSVANLYPTHDENISITYRPFGGYNEKVERTLWDAAQHAHVLVTHHYAQDQSERCMEVMHSRFDQLFREVIYCADMLLRRGLLQPNPTLISTPMTSGVSSFRRSEHGSDWNLATDIPWIHEVCCSILRSGGSDLYRRDDAVYFYEFLSEIQTLSNDLKLQRRGIHLHVQFRDVHKPLTNSISLWPLSTTVAPHRQSYLPFDYTETYLLKTTPADDHNAFCDQLDADLVSKVTNLPPTCDDTNKVATPLTDWQCLLLTQEEALHSADSDMLAVNKEKPTTKRRSQINFDPDPDNMVSGKTASHSKRSRITSPSNRNSVPSTLPGRSHNRKRGSLRIPLPDSTCVSSPSKRTRRSSQLGSV